MAQDFITPPPGRAAFDETDAQGRPVRANRLWTSFLGQVFAICFAVAQSGTTAQRPTVTLFAGRPYFDTSLGYTIWWDGSQWVDAAGSPA